MRFFIPDQEFVRWLIAYAGDRSIFDIGCGDGSLVREINGLESGKAFGIDLLWDYTDPRLPIFRGDSTKTKLVTACRDCICLFCRPCHSPWIEDTISLLPPDVEVLYIGLPRNLDTDLQRYDHIPLRHRGTSVDGEGVYRVLR